MPIALILLDIEGTTTAIDFVHQTLFPYSAKNLGSFLRDRGSDPAVQSAVSDALATARAEQLPESEAESLFLRWIREDRKHGALKQIQGMIWRAGFENGDYRGHVYEDVLPAFRRWREAGMRLAIYSSGSVEAQRLLFRHSAAGDLTPFLSHYFDTAVGPKRDPDSYRRISEKTGVSSSAILFLSDIPAELDAARAAGCQVLHLLRPGTVPSPEYVGVADFWGVDLGCRSEADGS